MKGLLIFAAGAACGVAGTLFWLQRDYKKRLDDLENRVFEAQNQGSEGSEEGSDGDKKDEKSDENESKGEAELRRVNENRRVLMGKTDLYGYTNYSGGGEFVRETGEKSEKIADSDVENEENLGKNCEKSGENDPENDENVATFFSESGNKSGNIATFYPISEEEYYETQGFYDKNELKFYAKNDVFVDFEGNCCHFSEKLPLCCHFCLQKVATISGDFEEQKLWVRCDKIGADFEILAVNEEYISDEI